MDANFCGGSVHEGKWYAVAVRSRFSRQGLMRHPLLLTLLSSFLTLSCGDTPKEEASDAAGQSVVDGDVGAAADANPEARFRIAWTLEGGCSRGETIESTVSSLFDGRLFVDEFDCELGEGLSRAVPSGDFEVQLRLIDTDDVVVPPDSGPTESSLVAISNVEGPHASEIGTEVPIAVAFPTASSSITASWNFSEDSAPRTCAQLSIESVDVVYERGGNVERSERIACADSMDLSGSLPLGLYTVRATPVNRAGIALFDEQESEVALFVGNQGASASFSFAAVPL